MSCLASWSFKILPLVFIATSFFSCRAQKIQSKDHTKEFGFTPGIEGPAVDLEGNIYAVNFAKEGTIGVVDGKGNAQIFITLPENSIGNGIRFDQQGNMFVADYVGHNVYKVEKGTKNPKVWSHNAQMSQPNDLAISPNGTIYLSDPNWKESTGRIWKVNDKREIVLLEENMGTTNGIEVSPDGKKLYVNESVQRMVWQYDINLDGSLSNKTKLISFEDFGMDGMRCDMMGNLYITRHGKGTVAIISPDGKVLQEIILKGKKPSNITFGGPNGKTCFVTMADRGCLESFPAMHKGSFYNLVH